jgi:hypothetical protein
VLLLGLFVGPRNKEIVIRPGPPPGVDFSAKNIPISLYNVVILWSFIGPLRSTGIGFGGHFFTLENPDPEKRAYFDWLQGGLDAEAVPAFFILHRECYRREACNRAHDPTALHGPGGTLYDPTGSMLYSRFFRDGT